MMTVDGDLHGGESREVLDSGEVPVHSLDWHRDAACQGKPVDLFFPALEDAWQIEMALDICATCQVRQECLTWAMDRGEDGVWGGTTSNDRRAMRGDQPRRLPEWMRREIRRQAANGVPHQTIADSMATTRRTVNRVLAASQRRSGEDTCSRL